METQLGGFSVAVITLTTPHGNEFNVAVELQLLEDDCVFLFSIVFTTQLN
jgi:hypothetical protein